MRYSIEVENRITRLTLLNDIESGDIDLGLDYLEKNETLALIDVTGVVEIPSTAILFHSIANVPYNSKIAFHLTEDHPLTREFQFIEMTAYQKGKSIAVFGEEKSAVEWLSE